MTMTATQRLRGTEGTIADLIGRILLVAAASTAVGAAVGPSVAAYPLCPGWRAWGLSGEPWGRT